jgi:glycosyltransferase involved in cell wall biosynthesis
MKVLICWSHISGYAAACWRALHALTTGTIVQVQFIAWESAGADIAFDSNLVAGLPIRMLAPNEYSNVDLLREHAAQFDPDVIVFPGWMHPPYMQVALSPSLRRARKLMYVDTPWRGTWRQRLARFRFASRRIRAYFDALDGAVVTGERSFQLLRHLGIPEQKIYRGTYGIDYASIASVYDQRIARGAWPRRFLFLGRYHEHKGIDVLLAAYAKYRAQVIDPWPLTCCGKGPLMNEVKSAPGVIDMGFVDPRQTPAIMAEHGALVLASAYDPWPLVIVEACAAGLPVIHSEACGSAVELVRPYYNGIGFGTGDVNGLARAMRWCHDQVDALPEMGRRGRPLAAAYAAPLWAKRWLAMFEDILARRPN